MRKNTAKIFFVVCVLLQGTNPIKASQALQTKFEKGTEIFHSEKSNLNSSAPVRSHWLVKATQTGKELVKIAKVNLKEDNIKSSKRLLAGRLSNLDAPPNLSLPQKPYEVRNQELYPLKITDLNQLIEANSPTLEIYRRQIEQQKFNLKKSISAWYPTIDLSATPQHLEAENYNDESSDTTSEQWKTTLSIEINWSLIDPARAPEIAAAKDTYEKAKTAYLIQLRDLQLEAISAYLLLQKSDEGVRIGKESVKASQVSLKDAKARFEAGLGTRLEVLEAETQLARDNRLLTKKLGDQSINRSSLSKILNLPPQITPVASTPPQIIGVWSASLEESIVSAYKLREELENIRLEISINNSNANAALASAQPKLSIFNTFSNSYTDGKLASIDNDGSSTTNTVGLKATWRIFDGNNARNGYYYNKEIAKVSMAKFADQRNTIRQEVEKDFIQLRTANQDIASSTREVIAARESLRLARLRFQAGVTTQREVVNNQRDLTQAEVGYSEAITAYNTSMARLNRRTGINHIQACNSPKLISNKDREADPETLPIEPFPVIKACPNLPIR